MRKLMRNALAFFRGILLHIGYPKKIGLKNRVFSGVSIRLYSGSKYKIGNNIKFDNNAVVAVQRTGELQIGNNVGIGPNNYIVCHKKISIGDGTILGPSVFIYDHDHEYLPETGVEAHKYKYGEVIIGKNCWIGANTVILKGTVIGNNCLVGAGCVIKGKYPDGVKIVQKRSTSVF